LITQLSRVGRDANVLVDASRNPSLTHGQLTNEFVSAILQDRTPLCDISQSLNMTVAGVVAHQSALRDGELLKIPQYDLGPG